MVVLRSDGLQTLKWYTGDEIVPAQVEVGPERGGGVSPEDVSALSGPDARDAG
jgi:hypothetical protein